MCSALSRTAWMRPLWRPEFRRNRSLWDELRANGLYDPRFGVRDHAVVELLRLLSFSGRSSPLAPCCRNIAVTLKTPRSALWPVLPGAPLLAFFARGGSINSARIKDSDIMHIITRRIMCQAPAPCKERKERGTQTYFSSAKVRATAADPMHPHQCLRSEPRWVLFIMVEW